MDLRNKEDPPRIIAGGSMEQKVSTNVSVQDEQCDHEMEVINEEQVIQQMLKKWHQVLRFLESIVSKKVIQKVINKAPTLTNLGDEIDVVSTTSTTSFESAEEGDKI